MICDFESPRDLDGELMEVNRLNKSKRMSSSQLKILNISYGIPF